MTCRTCGHRQHESGECKARYPVTFEPGEEGDPCLCTHQAWFDPWVTDGSGSGDAAAGSGS